MKQKIKVVGITGGIASGKSTIAKMLTSLGAKAIDADTICHRLMDNKEIREKVCQKWGKQILDKHGKVDRSLLGKIVFTDKEEISALNDILHPKVIKKIKDQIAAIAGKGKTSAIVIDAALLVESNLDCLCDRIVFVDAGKHICVNRAQIEREWPAHEITKREKFQNSTRQKKEQSDFIIDNNLSKENTLKQVKVFWDQFIVK